MFRHILSLPLLIGILYLFGAWELSKSMAKTYRSNMGEKVKRLIDLWVSFMFIYLINYVPTLVLLVLYKSSKPTI